MFCTEHVWNMSMCVSPVNVIIETCASVLRVRIRWRASSYYEVARLTSGDVANSLFELLELKGPYVGVGGDL